MALFRLLAWILLLIAVVALVSDITRTFNGGSAAFTTTFGYWKTVSPQSLASTTAFVKGLHPILWDPIAVRVLLLPIWLLFGGIGLAMALLGRRKRRVNIFAN